MIIYFTVTRPLRFFCIFQHFKECRPTSENPDPEPASRYETVTPVRRPPKRRSLSEPPKKKVKTALPDSFRCKFIVLFC